ncbi:MAG: hypothetical protein J6O40_00265 [Ruminococcus sp.]|nr:hypothetical protein [Ruminococcus sp.]
MKKLLKGMFCAAVMAAAAVSTYVTAFAEDVNIDVSEAVESSKWGQSITVNKADFDAERITKDSVIKVAFDAGDYSGEELPIELIFQSWNNTTSPNADKKGGVWAKITTDDFTEKSATFTYDAIVAAYGTDDFSEVQAICVGDTDLAPVTCKGMIITNCTKAKETINVSIDCSEAKRADNSNSSISVKYDVFDMTTLTQKSKIKITYALENKEVDLSKAPVNLAVQCFKDSNSPFANEDGTAWIAIEPESFDEKSAVFDYNAIVDAYGTADFSKIDMFHFRSTGADVMTIKSLEITDCVSADKGTHAKEEEVSEDESSEAAESAEDTTSTAAAAVSDSGDSDKKEKGSNVVFIIIGIVAGVAIAIGVIFAILTKQSSQEYDIDKRRMVSKKKPKSKAKW